MSTSSAKASAAGLVLLRGEGSGATQWAFSLLIAPPVAPPVAPLQEGVRAVQTRCGLGLVTSRPFAAGEVLLKDRWLVGVPMITAASSSACEQCLRVCAWSPVDSGCRGCRARYCSASCRDEAWRQHHQLLCPAVTPQSQPPGGATPLEVFAKHARLAPTKLQQKPEEVLLAARVLARCTLWDESESDAAAAAADAADAADDSGAAAEGGAPLWSRAVVPPPFHRLSSVCVIAAARTAGSTEEAAAARAAWLRDSYRLLLATPLGRHPRFATRCPPRVYSHTLGLIDTNAAGTRAVPAARLQAALAGGGGGAAGGGGGGVPGGGGDVEGIGIYPRFSWANHCCMPSAVNSKGPGMPHRARTPG